MRLTSKYIKFFHDDGSLTCFDLGTEQSSFKYSTVQSPCHCRCPSIPVVWKGEGRYQHVQQVVGNENYSRSPHPFGGHCGMFCLHKKYILMSGMGRWKMPCRSGCRACKQAYSSVTISLAQGELSCLSPSASISELFLQIRTS